MPYAGGIRRSAFAVRPWVIDAVIAFGLPLLRLVDPLPDDAIRAAAVLAVPLLGTVPLLWRRFHPWLVFAAVCAGQVVGELNDPEYHVSGIALCFACYAVARYTPAPRSLGAAAGTPVVLFASGSVDIEVTTVAVVSAGAVGVWLVGVSLRRIHADGARLRELAERLRAEQERNAERAVATERARIAYELHDLVARHVSAVAMMARATADEHPGMPGISETADTALTEMRRMLRLLASGDDLEPEPSLDHLDQLAGEHVEITTTGLDAPIPQAVLVSAYRIVQEALANVAKHAGATATRVHIGHNEGMVTITVDNDPPAPGHVSPGGTGLGLIGMRERAALFDGTLRTGRTDDGGWRAAAILRYET